MLKPYEAESGEQYAPQSLPADVEKPREEDEKLVLTDDDFLSIVKTERQNAIGIEVGDEIVSQRETAMQYFKGEMDDVPAMPGRSSVVSTDVADAIYSVLPDLVEIFIGGEDIGSFTPIGPEDVEAAKQETEVVNQVIMGENDGFGLVHDAIHDALLNKVGIFNFWAEGNESYDEQALENVDAITFQALMSDPSTEILSVEQYGMDEESGEPLYRVEIKRSEKNPCFIVKAVTPERFAVARDTADLRDCTYCVMETTPRAQQLKAQDFDPEIVDGLPNYQSASMEQIDRARDTVGESDLPYSGAGDSRHDLRLVRIYQHILRVDADGDGKPEIWRIDTDEQESVILQKVKLNRVPFSMGSPYRQPHRAYGRSVADLVMEIQKIKTALTRAAMDARYFSLNQRHEVAEDGSNEHTIADLLNNTPGYPVRVKRAGTINALNQKGFDGMDFEALEYWSTETEKRTGIVRNAQGLNPDTLHDTARGAEALMSRAQVRMRMIARTLGETLFKDLFLGVHGLMRDHGSKAKTVELRSGWVQVNPTDWGARKDMRISIGMGGGREHDLMVLSMIGDKMAQTVEAQASGAIPTPVIMPDNVFNYLEDFAERAGSKSRSRYFTDPKQTEQAMAQQPPKEDPAVIEAKGKLELQAQAQQQKHQLEQAESARKDAEKAYQLQRQQQADQVEDENRRAKAANEADIAQKKAAAETELALQAQNNEYALALREQDINRELKEREIGINASLRAKEIENDDALSHTKAQSDHDVKMTKAENDSSLPKKRPGGDLDK